MAQPTHANPEPVPSAAGIPSSSVTPPASHVKPGPTIRHQITKPEAAARPAAHIDITTAGESSTGGEYTKGNLRRQAKSHEHKGSAAGRRAMSTLSRWIRLRS